MFDISTPINPSRSDQVNESIIVKKAAGCSVKSD